MAAILDFYQIYYDEAHLKEIFPFAIPYKNEGLTVFFENVPIKNLVLSSNSEKISVCSWKLRQKLKWYIGKPRELTLELLKSDYEVMSFTKNTRHHRMLAAADQWHPGFLKIFDKILSAIGVKRTLEVKIPIYQNHFSAQTRIYKDYVTRYLSPAMEVMTNEKEISELCFQDSKYSALSKAPTEHIHAQLGINYFPLHPFLLERLFSVYCQNEGINITHL